MIYIGIDVAKDKHDCFITNSEGEVLFNAFTIPNNADGFHDLFQKISSLTNDFSNVKVGLEATGHYNYNLLGFLIDKGLPTFVINPLHPLQILVVLPDYSEPFPHRCISVLHIL